MKISHGRLYCEEVNRKRNEPLQIESTSFNTDDR